MFITGVIGYPLKATLSPVLHNSAFAALKIKGHYFPLCVPEPKLELMVKIIKKVKFSGFNITNPYKIKIIQYLDELSPVARKIGAVNTVIIEKQKLFGDNTDVYGFDKSLREYNINLIGKKVLLVGAGGVARAIAYVVAQKKPAQFFIANRTKAKAFSLIEEHKGELIDIKQISEITGEVDIVINATSIDFHKKIIPLLKKEAVYYETNYRFNLPQGADIKVINGITMLVYQAAYSFSIWTKRMPPIKIMKKIIEEVKID